MSNETKQAKFCVQYVSGYVYIVVFIMMLVYMKRCDDTIVDSLAIEANSALFALSTAP